MLGPYPPGPWTASNDNSQTNFFGIILKLLQCRLYFPYAGQHPPRRALHRGDALRYRLDRGRALDPRVLPPGRGAYPPLQGKLINYVIYIYAYKISYVYAI